MRCQARQLDSYSTARHCSTARQNSTELDRPRQTSTDLDRPRQTSTDLDRPRHPGACSQPRLASTGSTATRQLLDSYSTGSTGKALTGPRQRPRQRLDGASTARQLDSQGSRTYCARLRLSRAVPHSVKSKARHSQRSASGPVYRYIPVPSLKRQNRGL